MKQLLIDVMEQNAINEGILAARCVRASVCAPGEAVQDLHMPFRNVISPSVCTVTGHVHVPYKRTNSSWSSYCSWSALSQMSCKHARTGNNLIALHETLPYREALIRSSILCMQLQAHADWLHTASRSFFVYR